MPRIFGLRHCLQEVQDSILSVQDGKELNLKDDDKHLSMSWFPEPHSSIGSEMDIINIPGKSMRKILLKFVF